MKGRDGAVRVRRDLHGRGGRARARDADRARDAGSHQARDAWQWEESAHYGEPKDSVALDGRGEVEL